MNDNIIWAVCLYKDMFENSYKYCNLNIDHHVSIVR